MLYRHSGQGWMNSGWFIYLFIYGFYYYKVLSHKPQKERIRISLFFFVVAIIIDLTQFPIPISRVAFAHIRSEHQFRFSLNPSLNIFNLEQLFNFFMFVPFGMALTFLKKQYKFRDVALAVAVFTLMIEFSQLLTSLLALNVRIFDINDLITNFLGGIFGYVLIQIKRILID